MALVFTGMVTFILSGLATKILDTPVPMFGGLAGFALICLTIAGTHLIGFRCPWCRSRLPHLVLHRIGFRMDPRIRFCPYCGISLDKDYDGTRLRANYSDMRLAREPRSTYGFDERIRKPRER